MPQDGAGDKGSEESTVDGVVVGVLKRVLIGAILTATLFVVISVAFGIGYIPDLLSGLAAGTLSQVVSLQSSRRSMAMDPDKAKFFILMRYVLRFTLLAVTLGLLVVYAKLHPVPLLGGYAASVFVVIAVTYRAAKNDEFNM